jgi:hypothetical protein
MSSVRGALVPVFALYLVATSIALTLARCVGALAVATRPQSVGANAALAEAE